MNEKHTRAVSLISCLRWAIPTAISLVSMGYILLEQVLLQGQAVSAPHVVRSILLLGLVVPALIWLTLTWATKAALTQAEAQEELARRNRELTTLTTIGEAVSQSLDLDEILQTALDRVVELIGLEAAEMRLVEGGRLVLKVHHGMSPDFVAREGTVQLGHCLCGTCAQTGEAVATTDLAAEPSLADSPCAREGFQSTLSVPMKADGRVVGVIHTASRQRHAFALRDQHILEATGRRVAAAVQNARRYEAMIGLHETSLDIISQLDMAELLEALLRRGIHLWGAPAGSLFLYDAAQERIYNVAGHNIPWDLTGVTLHPGEGVIGQVIATGKPLVVDDYESWPGKIEAYTGTPLPVVMAAPLKWQDQVIGGVVILNDTQTRRFDEDDLWVLSLFADMATIAIKNAELHTQVRKFSQELERKVEERTQELSRAKEDITAKAEQLRSLLAKTIRIQEEERARIARDMHDGVIQLITAARYELQAAKVAVGSGWAVAAEEKLHAAREVLAEMEKEIRHAIYDLHPPILDAVGLVPALQRYASSLQELSGIACQIQVMGIPCPLPPPTEVAVFRMVEEALHNVVTHARARTASVTLDFRPTLLCVTVQDDGQGFNHQRWTESRDGQHLGLIGMRERIESLGGKMELWSKPGHGTGIMLQLPVQLDGG